MKRLAHRDDKGWYIEGENGDRLRGAHVDRLAAYEGTGFAPAEIKSLVAEWNVSNTLVEEYRAIGSTCHLRELVEAEKNGRLVALPKNYAEIFDMRGGDAYVIDGDEVVEVFVNDVTLDETGVPIIDCGIRVEGCSIQDGELIDTDRWFSYTRPLSEFGKTVFLTCEEAEAALEARKGAGHETNPV